MGLSHSTAKGDLIVEITKEERDEKQKKRTYIAKEILSTELSYVNSINQAIEVWEKPLRKACQDGKKVIPEEKIDAIFTNLSEIVTLHQQILKDLQSRIDTWSDATLIGDIFEKNASALTLYTTYINKFDDAISMIKKCEKIEKFQKFASERTDQPVTVYLPNILIQPIQRIPRYSLLLVDLHEKTWKTHPDFLVLAGAAEQMKSISKFINEQKRKYENKNRIEEVNCLIGKNYNLYEGLASEDDVDLVVEKNILVEKNGKSKTISYCLLTDSILFWLSSSNKKTPTKSPSNLFGKSKVYGLFKLKDLVISPKEETKIETSFENKVQTYSFNTPVERQSFLEIFEKTKSACLQNSFMDPNATGTKIQQKQKGDSNFSKEMEKIRSNIELSVKKASTPQKENTTPLKTPVITPINTPVKSKDSPLNTPINTPTNTPVKGKETTSSPPSTPVNMVIQMKGKNTPTNTPTKEINTPLKEEEKKTPLKEEKKAIKEEEKKSLKEEKKALKEEKKAVKEEAKKDKSKKKDKSADEEKEKLIPDDDEAQSKCCFCF